jgi:hypothetical protein
MILKDWTGGEWENRKKLKQGFIEHNENVRRLVPAENLLEFRVEQCWEPLCKFLGKDIPDEPYPRVNEGSNAAKYVFPCLIMLHFYFLFSEATSSLRLFRGIRSKGVWF